MPRMSIHRPHTARAQPSAARSAGWPRTEAGAPRSPEVSDVHAVRAQDVVDPHAQVVERAIHRRRGRGADTICHCFSVANCTAPMADLRLTQSDVGAEEKPEGENITYAVRASFGTPSTYMIAPATWHCSVRLQRRQ